MGVSHVNGNTKKKLCFWIDLKIGVVRKQSCSNLVTPLEKETELARYKDQLKMAVFSGTIYKVTCPASATLQC